MASLDDIAWANSLRPSPSALANDAPRRRVGELVRDVLGSASTDPERERLCLSGREVELDARVAIRLAEVLARLSGHARRVGAWLSGGTVELYWWVETRDDADWITLDWQEVPPEGCERLAADPAFTSAPRRLAGDHPAIVAMAWDDGRGLRYALSLPAGGGLR